MDIICARYVQCDPSRRIRDNVSLSYHVDTAVDTDLAMHVRPRVLAGPGRWFVRRNRKTLRQDEMGFRSRQVEQNRA